MQFVFNIWNSMLIHSIHYFSHSLPMTPLDVAYHYVFKEVYDLLDPKSKEE